MKDFVYKNNRPKLTIEVIGSKELGRCFNATYYRITSTHKLSREALKGLYDIGLLGSGQGFATMTKCDGTEAPAGEDEVPCVVVDRRTQEVLNEQAINPYSKKPYASMKMPYFVYETETSCDSGD